MLSLVRKCEFYRQDLTEKWGTHGTKIFLKCKNRIYQRNGAQRVDEKNGVIRRVLFTTKVMFVRTSKMALLCTFCWIQQKFSPSLCKKFKWIWKVLFSTFTKYCGFWSSELPLTRCQHLKIQDFGISLLTQHFFSIFLQTISHEESKACQQYHFLEELDEIFQVYLNILPKLWLFFCCHQ